jgi:1,4-alpha-glucan branching enzyme
MAGFLSIILTAHVPYLRAFSRHPYGEDALHETIAFSLIPVLNTLSDLRESGSEAPIGLAFSPILLEQLSDHIVQKHFVGWMENWLEQRVNARVRWERQNDQHATYLAQFYVDYGRNILTSFSERYNRNLPAALRSLCSGLTEPLAGAATHAYLPRLASSGSIHTQIQLGLMSITRHLGRMPNGLWLPECGYTTACLPAIRKSEVRYTIADPRSTAGVQVSHLRPRWAIPGRLQVLTNAEDMLALVYSPELGYPGDPIYRAPLRDPRSEIELWRNGSPNEPQALYDPYDAYQRAEEHAKHFLSATMAELLAFEQTHDQPGIVVVPIDLELLGRYWFEGPIWLRSVLESAMQGEGPPLAAPSEYLRAYRSRQNITLQEGSWGIGSDHRTWDHPVAQTIRRAVAEAEERMADMVRTYPQADGEQERALNQALRELLLAQSSDWLILAGRGEPEAMTRTGRHLGRFERMCRIAEAPIGLEQIDEITEAEEQDNPFPFLNYRIFVEGE